MGTGDCEGKEGRKGMATDELKFCRLCGKNKPMDEFAPIPLARLDEKRLIGCEGCKLCQTVVHNIRIILRETEEKVRKIEEKTEEKSQIIVPSVMVPRNIKN